MSGLSGLSRDIGWRAFCEVNGERPWSAHARRSAYEHWRRTGGETTFRHSVRRAVGRVRLRVGGVVYPSKTCPTPTPSPPSTPTSASLKKCQFQVGEYVGVTLPTTTPGKVVLGLNMPMLVNTSGWMRVQLATDVVTMQACHFWKLNVHTLVRDGLVPLLGLPFAASIDEAVERGGRSYDPKSTNSPTMVTGDLVGVQRSSGVIEFGRLLDADQYTLLTADEIAAGWVIAEGDRGTMYRVQPGRLWQLPMQLNTTPSILDRFLGRTLAANDDPMRQHHYGLQGCDSVTRSTTTK